MLGGTLKGNGVVSADVRQGGGLIEPGGSVGQLQINGELDQAVVASLRFELAGLAPIAEHDVLIVSAAATLGGLLELSLLPGFADQATAGDVITLMLAGTITGSFTNAASGDRVVSLDGFGAFDVFYGSGSPFSSNHVVLTNYQVIPEPSTLVLALAITAAAARRRRLLILRKIGSWQ